MDNSNDVRVPDGSSYAKRSKILKPNDAFIQQRREQLRAEAEAARAQRKAKVKERKEKRRVISIAVQAKLAEQRAELPPKPPTAEELARQEKKIAKLREKNNRWNRNWRRKKRAADPLRRKRLKAANQRRYQRRKRERERSERHALKLEQARLKREEKELRRAERIRKATEKVAALEAAGKTKKATPTERSFSEGFRQGFEEGKRVAIAEFEAKQAQERGNNAEIPAAAVE